MSDQQRVLSVTQLNEYIKMLLDGSPILSDICVKGEISNFVNHRTGHFYFSLKDEGGVVRAVMFKGSAAKLKFVPENGMKVIARGRVSSFVRDGQYQLYCEGMEPDGIGALYVAYEQLKRKLEEEGLFSEARKRPLPKIPTRVGIITSPTGAAVRDMINITGRRFPYAELVLYPSLVQGESAAKNLIAGVEYFNRTRRVDVIIIGRGGGSIEDLWAFNDEMLARAVASSAIPVISAVGHETDFTICDFASDRRAPTPSAAAELAVPDTAELKRKINNVTARMELLLSKAIEIRRTNLNQASQRRVLQSPAAVIDDKRMALLSLDNRMTSAEKLIVSASRNRFVALTAKLEALNPMSVVTRGYSAVFLEDGSLLKSVSQVSSGDKFSLRVSDGEISGVVTEKKLLEK
ncbi:MAG: exodeoxyribonuclease VII large subunit [Clostridia bacterium]|nr:exodeoxyribonuclease VII large subunit [Clostridia bacterium]